MVRPIKEKRMVKKMEFKSTRDIQSSYFPRGSMSCDRSFVHVVFGITSCRKQLVICFCSFLLKSAVDIVLSSLNTKLCQAHRALCPKTSVVHTKLVGHTLLTHSMQIL